MAKVNPVRMSALLRAVRDGNYLRTAAESVGVHFTTMYEWAKRGDNLIAEAKITNTEVDAELADWLLLFPDDFEADNAMWDAPPPAPFFYPEWQYVLFTMLLRKAKAQAESEAIKDIRDAGQNGNWQARAWWLERTRPDQYGRKQTIAHGGFDGGPLTVETASGEVSSEHLIERLRELRAKRELGE